MIDLHCHVLPGVDDGPASLAGSIELARSAAAAGTTAIVATPHIDHHWNLDPATIARRIEALAAELAARAIELRLLSGGEVALTRLADLSASELDFVRLGGGPYLLLECPMSPNAGDFDAVLLRVHARGQQVVLAHPERSPLFQREPQRLVRCVEAGMLASISAGALRGEFGASVRTFAIAILREEIAHNVASDAHDVERRPPGVARAFADIADELPGIDGQVEWLTRLVPAAVISGEPLPPRPPLRAS